MLLPEIVADCRARLAQRGWTRSPGLMVTIVSHQWELVVQGALVFRPPRCLVLSTQDMEAEKDKALAELRGRLPSCEPVDRRFTEGKVMAGRVQDLLEECCGSMAAGELLFDLTPGNKEMSLDLATAVAQPGNWLTHARHKMDAGYVIPGSQRY